MITDIANNKIQNMVLNGTVFQIRISGQSSNRMTKLNFHLPGWYFNLPGQNI